jgi:hypothetical protein
MNKFLGLFISALLLIGCHIQPTEEEIKPSRPFPQNAAYQGNYLMPTTLSQDELINLIKDYYNDWKKKYIKQCEDGTYYIDFSDENSNVGTVSEAHGYGMMIVAYMAGYDPNAKKIFDGMYNFYKKHPNAHFYSRIHPRNMSKHVRFL